LSVEVRIEARVAWVRRTFGAVNADEPAPFRRLRFLHRVYEGESSIGRSLTIHFRDGTTNTIGHG
jgi:hypothetical protein